MKKDVKLKNKMKIKYVITTGSYVITPVEKVDINITALAAKIWMLSSLISHEYHHQVYDKIQ